MNSGRVTSGQHLGLAAVILAVLLATPTTPTAVPETLDENSAAATSNLPAIPGVRGAVVPPRDPAAYALPARALRVSTSAQLIAALQGSTPRDIVLANGVYDNSGPFVNTNGHRLYAATLLGVTFRAGINMASNGGQPGGLVRGIAFDVADPAKTNQGGVIFTWGPQQRGIRILDATFYGHKVVYAAIMARQPEGLVVQRVRVRDFTDWGVLVDNNIQGTVVSAKPLLEDIDVTGVTRAVPQSGEGRSEACIGIGNTAVLRRARVRDCAWMGISPFNASHGSLFEHLDIDRTETGVYIEHFTSRSVFQHIRIGPNVEKGFTCEGTDPNGSAWGGVSSSIDNVIQDALIDSSRVGVLMGWHTTRTTVRRVTFRNQYVAAITDYKGVNNAYYDNDYSGILPGALPVSPVWWRQ